MRVSPSLPSLSLSILTLLLVSLNLPLKKTLIAQFVNYPSSLYLVGLSSSEKYNLYVPIHDL